MEEIEAELQEVLKILTQRDFKDSFELLQKRWDRCVCSHGDYFEGGHDDYDLECVCNSF